MSIALEKRLRKLEKTQQAKVESTVIDQEELMRREEFSKLWATPEGRRLIRTRAMESAERHLSAMRARKRGQLEMMASPEHLERLKKEWAAEDARDERIRAENKRVDAYIESLGGFRAWLEMCCTPGGSKYRGGG